MRGMSGHTVLAVTQKVLWHPEDPYWAGFLRTAIRSRVAVLVKNLISAQRCRRQRASLRDTV